MVSIGDSISGFTSGFGGFGGFGGNLVGIFAWFIVFLIVLGVAGFITYWFVIGSKYNKKITIFENIAGQGYVPNGHDKAMIVKIGDGGEEVLRWKKRKVYRTAYGQKIGKNHYAFARGSDGYDYNITFGDLDEELRKLGIKPVDRDMRYMHVAIRRNIKDRYERITFLQKYGGLLAYTGLIAVTGVMMWLLFDKFLDIGSSVNAAIQAAEQVTHETARLLAGLDSIRGGSGLAAAS